MYCPKCGLKNNDSASFCIKCGSKIILEDADASGDSILKDNSVELNYKNIETTNIKNQANENYNYKFDTKKDSYEKIGENYESTLRAYIGKNRDYYNSFAMIITSILFGYIGIDRFALGQIGIGILKFLTFIKFIK